MGAKRTANELLSTKKQYNYYIITKIYGGGGETWVSGGYFPFMETLTDYRNRPFLSGVITKTSLLNYYQNFAPEPIILLNHTSNLNTVTYSVSLRYT